MNRKLALGAYLLSITAMCCATNMSRAADHSNSPDDSQKRAATALEDEVVQLLCSVDPSSTLATLQADFAPKLVAAVAHHFQKLNPGTEPTAIESVDGRFVVVVIAAAAAGENGKEVRAKSDAELLLVVGGRAGARAAGGECYGGTGHAEATKGIGLALGGTGGPGNADGVGGGGGGGAGATGLTGSLALGGPGGKPGPHGGHGGEGNGVDPINLTEIVHAAKRWEGKK